MKISKLIIIVFCLLTITSSGFSEYTQTTSFTTGHEWQKKMSPLEKVISIIKPYLTLQRYGVPIKNTPQSYVEKIDRILLYNPQLDDEDVSNILVSAIYTYEPQTRPTLEALETELLRIHVKDSDILKPYVVLRQSEK